MAGTTSQQQQATVTKGTTKSDNEQYQAFVALHDVLALQLEHCATSAANYAYGARLIPDETFDKVFDRDTKSDAAKVLYLIKCVRNKIKGRPQKDAEEKMEDFLDCLRSDGVFDELVKSLEANVVEYKADPTVKEPQFEALKDPDIVVLAGGTVTGLATSAFAKGLLLDEEYRFILNGGNEKMMFVRALLDFIAQKIRKDPRLLETFITKVLDKIGTPVSDLGEQLRNPKSGMTC